MRGLRRFIPLLLAVTLGILVLTVGMAMGDERRASDDPASHLLGQGTNGAGQSWELRYRLTDQGDCLEFSVDGSEPNVACGFDIPSTTEIGFAGGLKPGQGNFFLYGLTSPRVATVEAKSSVPSSVATKAMPAGAVRAPLRFFIMVREPVENVDALVGLDSEGGVVQSVTFPKPEN